jgi:hypothetical protein
MYSCSRVHSTAAAAAAAAGLQRTHCSAPLLQLWQRQVLQHQPPLAVIQPMPAGSSVKCGR